MKYVGKVVNADKFLSQLFIVLQGTWKSNCEMFNIS